MRIALTVHALQGGGAERVMARLAERWSNAGHDVHLITWSAEDTDQIRVPTAVVRHGLDLMRHSTNPWQGLWANVHRVRTLRHMLCDLRPDFVLSFCDQMNICTLQAARGLQLPVWISEHSDPSRQRLGPAWEWWRRRAYPRCTGCIALTSEIADHLARWIPRSRLTVIPNAVDAVDAVDEPIGESPKRSSLLSVGRLSHEKGVDQLLLAWRMAHAQLADWELCIVGDGSQRSSLQCEAADLPRVHFSGWLSDTAPAYRAAKIFVLPSRYEGFPVALLEAMSHGLTCLATRCSQAVEELSQGGEAVQIVPTESPESIARALIELSTDPLRRQRMGAAARRMSRNYSWHRIGPLWDRLLDGAAPHAHLPGREAVSPHR